MMIEGQSESKAPWLQSFRGVQDGGDRHPDDDEEDPPPLVVHRHADEEGRDPGPDGVLEAVHEDALGERQDRLDRLA